MRILVLEHEPEAPAALFGEWAGARRHELSIAAVRRLARWPDPHRFDAVVSLGSDASVHADADAWIEPELELLREAHDAGVAVLGICFGAQALAKALGAEVRTAPEPEVCWRLIETRAPELVLPGPWLCWHEDEFGTPAGAELLAGSERQTTAFAAGRSLALQHHPEVDGRVALGWVEGEREKLAGQGVDAESVRAQIAEQAPGARGRAFTQFDRIAEWWRRSSSLDRNHRAQKETR